MSTLEDAPDQVARLKLAGFSNELGLWRTPDGQRVMGPADAIAALDAGDYPPLPTVTRWPGAETVAEHARHVDDRMRQAEETRAEAPEPPPWLLAQAEVITEMAVEKLRPVIRAEVRAALKAELRKGGT